MNLSSAVLPTLVIGYGAAGVMFAEESTSGSRTTVVPVEEKALVRWNVSTSSMKKEP